MPIDPKAPPRRPCPVCCTPGDVYSDPDAPMVVAGSPNPTNHHCQKTGTWKRGARYGRSEKNLQQNLRAISWKNLRDWPRVARMKADLLGVPVPACN
jgi:hypothetical protein